MPAAQKINSNQFAPAFQMSNMGEDNNGGFNDATLLSRDAPVDTSWTDRGVDPVISSSAQPVRSPSEMMSHMQAPPGFQSEKLDYKT